jgi:hypothetical protein
VLAPASLRFNAHKTGPGVSVTSENLPSANGHSSEGIPQAAAQHCLHNRARFKQGKGTEAPRPASTRDPRLAKGCPIRASPYTTSTRHAMRVSGIFADHNVSAIFPHHYHFSIDRRHVISITPIHCWGDGLRLGIVSLPPPASNPMDGNGSKVSFKPKSNHCSANIGSMTLTRRPNRCKSFWIKGQRNDCRW